MIHGWGFDSRVLGSLAAALESDWNIRLLDMPGYGGNRAAVLPRGIDELSVSLIDAVPANSILLGWSLGGLVALKLAGFAEKSIRAVVLLASTPCFMRKADWHGGLTEEQIQDLSRRTTEDPRRALREFARVVAEGDPASRQIARKLALLLTDGTAVPAALTEGLAILQQTDLRQALARLSCPVLMLLGDRDALVTIHTQLAIKTDYPSVQMEMIENSGHALFISRPAIVAEKINQHLWELR